MTLRVREEKEKERGQVKSGNKIAKTFEHSKRARKQS